MGSRKIYILHDAPEDVRFVTPSLKREIPHDLFEAHEAGHATMGHPHGLVTLTKRYMVKDLLREEQAWDVSIGNMINSGMWTKEKRLHAIHNLAAYYTLHMPRKEALIKAVRYIDGLVLKHTSRSYSSITI